MPQDEPNNNLQDSSRQDERRNEPPDESQPVHLSIDGTLDLHMFAPQDCLPVLREYIHAAQGAGITELRIIHGKGIGTLREIVHAELRRNRAVISFALADASGGGWGATLAKLHSAPPDSAEQISEIA